MEIILDHREAKLIEIFERDHTDIYRTASLPIGDIHIINKVTQQIMLCIERKTASDLYSSIRDGRHREQKKRALDNLQPHQFVYCIEGPHCKLNDMRKKIIDGALLNTIFRDKLRVITTHSVMDTVQLVINLLKKISDNPDWFQEETQNNVTTIENHVKYEDLIKLQKKENMTPRVCQILFLAQIPGMSQHISREVLSNFSCIKSMIVQLSSDLDPIKRLTDIELETITGKKRKLGKVLAKRIYTCLFMDGENFL